MLGVVGDLEHPRGVRRDVRRGILDRAPVGAGDLAAQEERRVELTGLVHAEVEQVEQGVVPAPPRRQPVDGEQAAGGDLDAELLLDLALDAGRGRLPRVDDAAGQVPLLLVAELAEQHSARWVAQHALGDRPLAGQAGVEDRDAPQALPLGLGAWRHVRGYLRAPVGGRWHPSPHERMGVGRNGSGRGGRRGGDAVPAGARRPHGRRRRRARPAARAGARPRDLARRGHGDGRAARAAQGRPRARRDHVGSLERDRMEQFGSLRALLARVEGETQHLGRQTASLAGSLRSSTVRGAWGEVQLRRVLEASGMLAALRLRRAGRGRQCPRPRGAARRRRPAARAARSSSSTPRRR